MSAILETYHCNEWKNEYTEFYLKHEVDKVIVENNTKIIQLEAFIDNYNKILREIVDNANHQKYKRCLAISEKCFESREYWRYRYEDLSDKGYDRTYKWHKVEFWGSWGRCWLKISEKFKGGRNV